MEEKDIFRTAVFGGYQKDDVTDYIRSLENENETIRILANKEKSDLKTQLEKEKAVSEELKASLAALHNRLSDLEKDRPEEAPPSPAPSGAARGDALKYSLEEERKAIREDRQQWADNLAKMQQDMQSLWQNELQQLRSTLEVIQTNLKQPARDPQDTNAGPAPAAACCPETAPTEESPAQPENRPPETAQPSPASSDGPQDGVSDVTEDTARDVVPDTMQDAVPDVAPDTILGAAPDVMQDAVPDVGPDAAQDIVPAASSPAASELFFSENETAQEEPAAPAQDEEEPQQAEPIQKAEYVQKADASISQTQKRASDLLLKLDDF